MKDEKIKLGARLGAVADAVRDGIVLYDVGSDHAYLPAFLLSIGKIPYAHISDVAQGPLSKAIETIEYYGLSDKATIKLSDGLKDVTISPPCDISIAGMGGELIVQIIDACPDVKSYDVRLILQPMTRQEELRRYLCENGFDIEREVTVRENKSYTVITCRYAGSPYTLEPSELLIGRMGARNEDEAFYSMVKEKLKILSNVRDGRASGGITDPALDLLISSLTKIIEEGNI